MTALEARRKSINNLPPTEWQVYSECKSRCMAAIQTQANLGRFSATVFVHDTWKEFDVLFPVWRDLENLGFKVAWDLCENEIMIIRW